MTTTPQPEPTASSEIQAVAARIAHDLVVYALSDICNLLGTDCIGEAIEDDEVANRLDRQAEGQIFGLVWDQLGRASADYQRTAPTTALEG